MRLPLTLLKDKMHDATDLFLLKLRAIKCLTGQICPNRFMEQCNTQDGIQTQTQTFTGRSIIARPENSEYYTLINSPKSRVKKVDYLGQAILKTQSKVVTGPYW
jgi:hypothetical protein